mmetsp:Transcript_22818/g.17268  ORF Transcript_22818/g.17268 Transcript_22818/m.17268 type:complete len:269 (+) Transcript_22818:1392-2198(+)
MHNFQITDKVKDHLIINYAREPGVRSLKKFINKITEKIAFKIVEQEGYDKVCVDVNNLEDFIGHAIFKSAKLYDDKPPGVVIGLAYNEYGGSILFIESTIASHSEKADSHQGQIKITGSLGDVMKESSSLALTYTKNFLHKYYPDKLNNFAKQDIHIHFPEGAVKKDGPSAGITITTALLSLALNEKINQNVAMTGEISLNGKVLAIGGVKEKTMSAQREGITTLIFPKANEKDVNALPKIIKEGITFHFVEDYPEVFKIMFPNLKIE